ncbi:ABC transporter substrate-binding protein [Paenibacillus sp. P36]|uniref:ABC transporter substrate-binding protein n=1 Tax=Paenibacillus sp. P36 TaxID=3342538 RepID=UPI0038B2A2D4
MFQLKKYATITSVVLLTSVFLAGCGAGNDTKQVGAGTANSTQPASSAATQKPETERTLTDAMGHTVKVPAQPKRIIAPFLEDGLTALGVKPVAQWSAAGQPQEYLQKELKDVAILHMEGGLKPEEALSYNPDLIILTSEAYIKNGSYEEFSKVAPTYVLSKDENDWRGNFAKLGEVLGKSSEADQAAKKLEQTLIEAKEQIRTKVGDKTAVLLQAGDKGYKLFGAQFYSGKLLYDGLGFKQPKLLKGDYETYSMESLAQLDDVDYLFVLSGKGRAKPPVDNPLWKQLPAVKQGHVFDADSGHWFNQNVIANQLIIDDVLRDVVK